MKKQTVILLVAAIGIVAILGFGQFLLRTSQTENNTFQNSTLRRESVNNIVETQKQIPPGQVRVIIDFGQGKTLTGDLNAKTVFDGVNTLSQKNDLSFEYKKFKYGVLINKIGDKENSGNSGWVFSVNGASSTIAADRYVVNPGDIITWEYKNF